MIFKITTINFKGKYIPLSDYKGPLLKLTEADAKHIRALTEKKNILENQLKIISQKLASKKERDPEYFTLFYQKESFQESLVKINNTILGVKKERLRKQKLELEQRHQ